MKTVPVLDKLAYTLPNFAAAVDVSLTVIRDAINAGDLVPSYPSTRPVITREEGERWLKSLPTEKANA